MAKWEVNALLEILGMPKDQQRRCLEVDGILKTAEDEKGAAYLTESLAETAFRMRDEVIKAGCDWLQAVCEVIEYCEGIRYCKECHQKRVTKNYFNWNDQAQPIHWIVATLIAEVRKEEEVC